MYKQYISLLLLVSILVTSCKTKEKEEYSKLRGDIFGTTYSIIYEDSKNYQEEINTIFNDFNNSLSTYIPTSIVSKVNQNDSTVVVDMYFIEAFNKAKRIYKETDGFFDQIMRN